MNTQFLLQTIPSGPFLTNAYLIACLKTGACAIIDPSPGSKDLLIHEIETKGLTPLCIILTHSHWDHIADVHALSCHFPSCKVLVQEEDAPNLMSPGADLLPLPLPIEAHRPDLLLHEGDIIHVGELLLEVLHTPGHSPGSICLYVKKEGLLFSGDTLFKRSIGNLSFPTSDKKRMWPSLEKLCLLPKETQVFPGHGESTTLANESWLSRAEKIFG